jgi:Zn finger protein HypA/HybF involved in hydrogenase expression
VSRRKDRPDGEVIEAAKTSKSFSEVCRKMGSKPEGQSHTYWKNRVRQLGVSTTHFRPKAKNKIPLEDVLVEGSKYYLTNTTALKARLISEGILEEACSKCKCPPMWEGGSLVLQIDHINGKSNDQRLTNLRILCPNCHSQTHTYAGKNKGK